jgi:hypothetical protein
MKRAVIQTSIAALACIAAVAAPAQPAAASKPDVVLTGKITAADLNTYKTLPFEVPAGTHRVSVVFSNTQRDQRTVIDLGLIDPESFRGWSGSNKTYFTVSDVDATMSYLPGALPPGTWSLLLGIANIRPGVTAEYKAEIYLGKTVDPPYATPDQRVVLNRSAGWYKGDLHTHTGQSDGSCASMTGRRVPCPEFKLLEAAAARGLDFLAVTEHDTPSSYASMLRWQDYFDRMLLVRGREITTYRGHTNIFGTSDWVDFRLSPANTADTIADRVHALGGILSINHPKLPTGEVCMGCGWNPEPPLSPGKLDALEVINGIDVENNRSGIPVWQQRLQSGERVTAIGGSDDHDSGTRPGHPVGTPTTVVYAKELSESAILDGIRAGHVFLKTSGPDGPDVYLSAEAGAQRAIAGDALKLASGERAQFTVEVKNGSGDRLEIVSDDKVAQLVTDPTVTGNDGTKRFELTGDGQRHWYRVNLRGPDGTLLVLTNPIYVNFPAR